jgi:hypothetical protein
MRRFCGQSTSEIRWLRNDGLQARRRDRFRSLPATTGATSHSSKSLVASIAPTRLEHSSGATVGSRTVPETTISSKMIIDLRGIIFNTIQIAKEVRHVDAVIEIASRRRCEGEGGYLTPLCSRAERRPHSLDEYGPFRRQDYRIGLPFARRHRRRCRAGQWIDQPNLNEPPLALAGAAANWTIVSTTSSRVTFFASWLLSSSKCCATIRLARSAPLQGTFRSLVSPTTSRQVRLTAGSRSRWASI